MRRGGSALNYEGDASGLPPPDMTLRVGGGVWCVGGHDEGDGDWLIHIHSSPPPSLPSARKEGGCR